MLERVRSRIADRSRIPLLDLAPDPDHHRTVLTLAGPREEVAGAILALFDAAVEAIDLRGHRGVHPRMGAVDVVPIVPLGRTRMAACVDLARELGAEIAGRFGIPVYLYERAAPGPERARLEEIRRGEFEGFPEKILRPEWRPDFGPARVHPTAGVVAVGARGPLIAFNVDLESADIRIARAIARSVRERDGGLPGLKAMGVFLEGRNRVQVSMNLTDPRRTPIHEAFERVRAAAGRWGVEIASSEIVGLVPREAIRGVAVRALRLEGFGPDRVLENRLAAAGFAEAARD
ncbi:MAG: glutamate formimidoyltransferase [Acidobacteria bacterium]|nr:glutamate formimidoyltransferase [Acidobacteriota bacterium]